MRCRIELVQPPEPEAGLDEADQETILVVGISGGSSVLELEILEGTVERITFRNEESLYTVARFAVKGQKQPITAVGRFISIHPGESFRLRGVDNPSQYGRQFQVEKLNPSCRPPLGASSTCIRPDQGVDTILSG